MKAICCGSFDPITKGHEDVIRRAARLFDQVVVLVAHNPEKQSFFSVQQRVELCKKTVADLSNVTVEADDGVVVDYARKIGAQALVKGIRGAEDLDYETRLAQINRLLAPEIETVLLPAEPRYSAISSTYVREFIRYGKPLDAVVPEAVLDDIRKMIERM